MSRRDRHRRQDDDDGPPTRPPSPPRGDAPPNLAASAVAPPPPAGSPHPMIPVRDALRTVLLETSRALLRSSSSPPSFETLPIHPDPDPLLRRTLAEDVRCPSPGYPSYDASVMDGYAVNVSERRAPSSDDDEGAAADGGGGWTHEVLDKVYAGDDVDVASGSSPPRLGPPGTVYVTTGAPVPPGYDCVIPVELSTLSPDGSRIKFSSDAAVTEGKWIRKVGCDIAPGEVVLEAGCVLDPVGIALCVQVGVKEVKVRRSTRVGVLSTGNELIDPLKNASASAAKHGHIPDVNRPLLLTLFSTYNNCATVDLGILPDDDVPSLAAQVEGMLRTVDVMVTTGGISAGEKDVMERVFVDGLGAKVHFGRMRMKPGKPTTFLTRTAEDGRRKLIFCLPGNPVSAGVCAELLVRPSLDLLHSCPAPPPGKDEEGSIEEMARNATVHPEIAATLTSDIKLDVERPEYHRVTLTYHHPADSSSPGHYTADSTGVQRSSRLLSLRNADGLMALPQGVKGGKTKAFKGERYTVLISRRGFGGAGTVKAKDSVHWNGNDGRLRVRVVLVPSNEENNGEDEDGRGGTLESLGERVVRSLGGEGKVRVASSARHDGPESDIARRVLPDATAGDDAGVDACIAVCAEGRSFRSNLDVSAAIRKGMTKTADAMALQMRRGAASAVPIAALFEFVAGYASAPEADAGTVVLCVPEIGLEGALGSLGGKVLGHAVKVGRGGGGSGTTSHGRHGHGTHHRHHH